MLFSELYSVYYNTIASIISNIIDGEKNEKQLQKIVAEYAFNESAITIIPALKSEKWQLTHRDMTTSLEHKPTLPLTILQKRWLKAISLDPRMKLFDVTFPELDDVEPLFVSDDYYVYDKYSDGDMFEDEEYKRQFKVVLKAIKNGTQIKFNMTNRHGNDMFVRCYPKRLEYSEKDDKFRVITSGWRNVSTVNLSKMRNCTEYNGERELVSEEHKPVHDTLIAKIIDERNTLERFMLHFAHFEKQAERLDDKTYVVKIKYLSDDVSEMVIRILSFGPKVEILGPEKFKSQIIEKLKKQKSCKLV